MGLDHTCPEETPSQAWKALRAMPRLTAISTLRYEHYWPAFLPHIVPNDKKRENFAESFFSEESSKKRNNHIFGAINVRRKKALHVKLMAELAAQGPVYHELYDDIGKVITCAISEGDHILFGDLQKILKDGAMEDYKSSASDRWRLFSIYVLDHGKLPTKKETKTIWKKYGSPQRSPSTGKKELIVSDKQSNKWRSELGLQGLPI
ncbi:hypothetical protein HW115_08510 [Verrucomicrobiaceae bacterium N1E253]|uniref:Uncharacterized protein n=1 Tax=Oceaniferula marina TaxID=2748318 RepID=A0A851GIE8_9BACT|nr:hypothetical protein [Oceaniferula marina]NWK55651.1 hypothetical protein [Oceaniferula marina]